MRKKKEGQLYRENKEKKKSKLVQKRSKWVYFGNSLSTNLITSDASLAPKSVSIGPLYQHTQTPTDS